MNRLGLNDVQAESYLAILTGQSMIIQNNDKYVAKVKRQGYLASTTESEKSKPEN